MNEAVRKPRVIVETFVADPDAAAPVVEDAAPDAAPEAAAPQWPIPSDCQELINSLRRTLQAVLYALIDWYRQTRGNKPVRVSQPALAKKLGLSLRTVSYSLKDLIEIGLLRYLHKGNHDEFTDTKKTKRKATVVILTMFKCNNQPATHDYRRKKVDRDRDDREKREAVLTLLKGLPEWTDRQIAERIGVTQVFVSRLRGGKPTYPAYRLPPGFRKN